MDVPQGIIGGARLKHLRFLLGVNNMDLDSQEMDRKEHKTPKECLVLISDKFSSFKNPMHYLPTP